MTLERTVDKRFQLGVGSACRGFLLRHEYHLAVNKRYYSLSAVMILKHRENEMAKQIVLRRD